MLEVIALLVTWHVATGATASKNDSSIVLDDEGRLHILSNDLMVANISIQDIWSTAMTLNAAYQQQAASTQELTKMVQDLNESLLLERQSNQRQYDTIRALQKQLGLSFDARTARVQKIIAKDAAMNHYFGTTIAISSTMLVVGSPFDDENGGDSGSAYVYEKNTTGAYVLASKLTASDGVAKDRFGSAVAVTDSVVVVGAHFDDDLGDRSGAAYVFERNSTGAYVQTSKLVADDGTVDDCFGFAVAATDSAVVIGAYRDGDGGQLLTGAAYVFEKNSTGAYVQAGKLFANDAAAGDRFGRAVAVSDNGMVVVGAPSAGSVHVFEKNRTGAYVQVGKLSAANPNNSGQFGYPVVATNTMVVVGAYQEASLGSAYVFS
eukprot:m.72729 g.72729  ORF g.72729 m.72729 type:complete len:377 (+) comp14276_c2_seq7:91-1221(+)